MNDKRNSYCVLLLPSIERRSNEHRTVAKAAGSLTLPATPTAATGPVVHLVFAQLAAGPRAPPQPSHIKHLVATDPDAGQIRGAIILLPSSLQAFALFLLNLSSP